MKGFLQLRRSTRLLLSVAAGLALTAVLVAPVSAAGGPSISYRTIDVPGYHGTFLEGINNNGVISGQVIDASFNSFGFVSRSGAVTVFDYPGTSGVTVWAAINDPGTVTGQYVDTTAQVSHSYIRTAAGKFTAIDDPSAGTNSGEGTLAFGINDAGVVAGFYVDVNNVSHGFLWLNGAFTEIDVPGAGTDPGEGTTIGSVSNAGVITGTYTDSAFATHAFIDDQGRLTTFDAPGFPLIAVGSGNNKVTTGTDFHSGTGHGFLRIGGQLTELNEPNANTNAGQGTYAVAIDNRGRIVAGGYWDTSGALHGWIATLNP